MTNSEIRDLIKLFVLGLIVGLLIVIAGRLTMVRGHHIATCHACGKQWMVGDCIPVTCPECVEKGHGQYAFFTNCPQCVREHNERETKIAAAIGREPKLWPVPVARTQDMR
jgi:hypothetical protein